MGRFTFNTTKITIIKKENARLFSHIPQAVTTPIHVFVVAFVLFNPSSAVKFTGRATVFIINSDIRMAQIESIIKTIFERSEKEKVS